MGASNNKLGERMIKQTLEYLERNVKNIEKVDGNYIITNNKDKCSYEFNSNDKRIILTTPDISFHFIMKEQYMDKYDNLIEKLKKIEEKNKPVEKPALIFDPPKPDPKPISNERLFEVHNKKNQNFEMTDSEIYKEVIFSDNFNREFKKLKVGEEMYYFDMMLHFKRIR